MAYSPEQIKEFEFRQRYEQEQAQNQQPQQDPALRARLQASIDGLNNRMANDDVVNAGRSGFASIPGQLAGAAMSYGRNLINLPNTLSGGKIPAFLDKNYDYYDAMGVNKGITGDIAEGVLDYSPFAGGAGLAVKGAQALSHAPRMAAAIPSFIKRGADASSKVLGKLPGGPVLAENVLGGAAYGATHSDNPLQGAAFGAATGAAAAGLGKVTELGLKQIGKAYSQSAIPGLVDKAAAIMGKNPSSTVHAAEYKAAHDIAKAETNALWSSADSLAKNLDDKLLNIPGAVNVKLNPKPYRSYVDGFIESKSALEPAKRAKYEKAIELAKEFQLKAPQSISGIVALRQNANSELKKFIEKNNMKAPDEPMKEFLAGIKEPLEKSVPDKVPGYLTPEVNQFKKAWKDANESTANLQKFYEAPAPGAPGVMSPNKGLRKSLNQQGGELDAEVFGKFAPKPAEEGAAGVDQLAKILGSEKKASESVRDYLGRTLEKGQNPLNLYRGLSPTQRTKIFGSSPEGKELAKALEIEQKFGVPKSQAHNWGHTALGMSGPGLGVTAYGLLTGDSFEKALGEGAAVTIGGTLLSKGMGKYAYKNPKLLDRAIRIGERGYNNPGRGLNFAAQPAIPFLTGYGRDQ